MCSKDWHFLILFSPSKQQHLRLHAATARAGRRCGVCVQDREGFKTPGKIMETCLAVEQEQLVKLSHRHTWMLEYYWWEQKYSPHLFLALYLAPSFAIHVSRLRAWRALSCPQTAGAEQHRLQVSLRSSQCARCSQRAAQPAAALQTASSIWAAYGSQAAH